MFFLIKLNLKVKLNTKTYNKNQIFKKINQKRFERNEKGFYICPR